MPAWDVYKAEAKSRGALALEVYVAVSTPVVAPEKLREVLPDHLAYVRDLEERGAVMLAGPLSTEDGAEVQGMGMLILRAGSLKEARELAANDPMHKTGARTFTLRRWMINEGSVTISAGLSSQSVLLV